MGTLREPGQGYAAFPAHAPQPREATGAARRTRPLELPGLVRLSRGNGDMAKARQVPCLPAPASAAAAILKFIGIITCEKSVPREDGRGWRWVADCALTIRLIYAKANK